MTSGARADVVLVPGYMQTARSWDRVLAHIGRRYRARALDHRRHDLEGRLGEIEAAAAAGAALVGYSLGGRLALHAALRAAREPERLGALIVLGTSAGIEDPADRGRRRRADERLADWIESSSIEEIVAHWERIPALAGQEPALVAAQRRDRLSQDPRRLAELLRSAGQGALEPVWDRLSELAETPLLALAGERDSAYVEAARRLAAAVPNGRFATVSGAGHAAHLESPAAFSAALLEFLDEHLGERRVVDEDPEARSLGDGLEPD
jgi:2-succinyl-6-hydroxy-2,4-cyclohexadiene-1-carboxylate synthase